MKDFGSARRLDELGRVTIPKEIRKTLGMTSGDLIQIYIDKDLACMKKYSPVRSLGVFAADLTAAMAETSDKFAAVTDTEKIVCASGKLSGLDGAVLSEEYLKVMHSANSFLYNRADGGKMVRVASGLPEMTAQFIAPITYEKSVIGSVILFGVTEKSFIDGADIRSALFGARFLSRRFDGGEASNGGFGESKSEKSKK